MRRECGLRGVRTASESADGVGVGGVSDGVGRHGHTADTAQLASASIAGQGEILER